MTVFDGIKVADIDELVELFGKYSLHDAAPWSKWFDEKYCGNCVAEIKYIPEIDREAGFGWCELNQNCRYFPEMDDVPDTKQIIKMWLESELN